MMNSLNRRAFLKQATACSAALATTRLSLGDVGANDRLGVAVIGCGGIARAHGPALTGAFEIRAVCEVDRHRGEEYVREFAPDAPLLDDYREAIAREDIDALFVCTPDHWHAHITAAAMHAGKDVYCEKPLTLTIVEGDRLRDVTRQTGRILQIGTQQRSEPDFQTAVALVRAGRIGQLKRITTAIGAAPVGGPFPVLPVPPTLDWDRWLGPAPAVDYRAERCHGNFRWWYEYSGGKMTDWGAHHVDIALWAVDLPSQGQVAIDPLEVVHPQPLAEGMPTRDDSYNTAATFHVRCVLPGGVELDIRDTALDLGFENGILFEGTEGRFFVNRGKLTGKPVEQLAESPLPEGLLTDLRKGRELASHRANFYHACRDRRPPLSDVDSHVRHLNVCHAANVSMRVGDAVGWDLATDAFDSAGLNSRWRQRVERPVAS